MTRGRKNVPAVLPAAARPAIDAEAVREDLQAVDTLGEIQRQTDTNVRAVAATLGYQLPGDCADPDLIQRDIAINMRRSVEACLEVGRGLRALKEACPHGNFQVRLEVLGIDDAVARKFMQAATRFSKRSTSSVLTSAVGGQSKLFEMLILDDGQLEELELTGQTGELHLDDVATMSVKELRAAVREAKATIAAKDDVLAETQKEAEKLREEKAKRTRYTAAQAAKDAAALRASRLAALKEAALNVSAAVHEFGIVVADVAADATDADMAMNSARWLAQTLADLYANHAIDVDFAAVVTPPWTKAEAQG